MDHSVYESSYIDDDVQIGKGGKIGIFSTFNQVQE